jgi:hypothetical protein
MISSYQPRLFRKSIRCYIRRALSVVPLESRCVPTATITGTVYNDANGNGVQDPGELGISGVTVFLSINNTGVQAASDPTAVTDANGVYTFNAVATNRDYVVAPVVPSGYSITGPARNGSAITSFATNNGLTANTNVNTSKRSGEESETSVTIDPTNPNRVFVMSNEISGSGMNDSYSSDGGVTWTNGTIPSNDGDPTATFDMFGNLWIAYLTTSVGTAVSRSTNGGQSFSLFQTLKSSSTDQPTIVAGPSKTAGQAMIVVSYESGNKMQVQSLQVNSSGPIGTFTAAKSVPSSTNNDFGDPTIGPNGQVAIAYNNSSTTTGPDSEFFNYDADIAGGGSFNSQTLASSTNVGSFFTLPAQPNRSIDSEVGLAWDYSGGAHNGRLYMCYTNSPAVGSNDTDIYLRYTDNASAASPTWSSPLKINDDGATGRTQMLPRMRVDQTTGIVAITWSDCRDDASNVKTEYWGTVSYDGGVSRVANIKLSGGQSTYGSTSFTGGNDYGDYTDMSFVNGRFVACWTDNSNSTGDNPDGTLLDHDIYIAKVVVAKNVSNYFVSAVNGQTYSSRDFGMHSANPTVTINQAAAQIDPTNTSPINFSVVFSSSVTGFGNGGVTLSGTAGATTINVTGSGATYNVAVSGMINTGTVIATVQAGAANNGGSPNLASTSTDNTVTFDNVAPTAVSTPASVTTSGASSYQFTVTYNDDLAVNVSTLDNSDVTVTGPGAFSAAAKFVSVDNNTNGTPRTATYSITPPGGIWDSSDNGTYSVVMQGGQVTDTAGNAVAAGTLNTFNVNIAPLTVTIDQAVGQADPTNGSPINFTVVFSAAVTGFTNSGVTLSGTAGATTANVTGSGTTYNVAVSGMTAVGTVIATIPAGVASGSGNQNQPSTSTDNTVTFDNIAPTASSSPSTVTASGATSFSFTVNFSDNLAISVGSLDNNDLRVSGPNGFNVPASFVSVDTNSDGTPRVGTYSITPPGGFWDSSDNGAYNVLINGGQVFDTAGNSVAAGTIGSFNVNIAPLTVTIDQAVGQGDPTNASPINYTVVFSAPVSDFATGDVTLSGTAGATSAIVTGSGTTYNVAVSGMTGNGTVIASLAAGVASNSGNQSQASTSTDNTVTYDATAPTAASTPSNVYGFGGTSYSFTVTYNDNLAVSVASLDNNDIRVTGPGGFDTPATFVGVDVNSDGTPRVATYSITPPGGSWDAADVGTYAVALQSGQVFDTAGNVAATGTLGTFTVSANPPAQVTGVQINDGSVQRSEVRSLTVTFNQAVTLPANPADAFTLKRQSDNAVVNLSAVQAGSNVTLSFTGGAIDGTFGPFSLQDGRYTLTVLAAQVNGGDFDGNGDGTTGDNYVLVGTPGTAPNLFRFFGDINGDGTVSASDFIQFRQYFGGVNSAFDFDGDGSVAASDFIQFRLRFGGSI